MSIEQTGFVAGSSKLIDIVLVPVKYEFPESTDDVNNQVPLSCPKDPMLAFSTPTIIPLTLRLGKLAN